MMPTTLREQFTAAGAVLVPDGDTLRIEAPQPLPPALLARLRERREEMIEAYAERAAIMEHDGGLTRSDAEAEAARAALDVLDVPEVKGKAAGLVTRHYADIQTTTRTEEDAELMELSQ